VDVERQRLLAQTRDLVNKGLQADHLWHTATHADYARPMLQVLPSASFVPFVSMTMTSCTLAVASLHVSTGIPSCQHWQFFMLPWHPLLSTLASFHVNIGIPSFQHWHPFLSTLASPHVTIGIPSWQLHTAGLALVVFKFTCSFVHLFVHSHVHSCRIAGAVSSITGNCTQ